MLEYIEVGLLILSAGLIGGIIFVLFYLAFTQGNNKNK